MGLSETLKAISAPVRREILDYLKSGPKSAGEISQQFDLAPATVSHHLSTLRKTSRPSYYLLHSQDNPCL